MAPRLERAFWGRMLGDEPRKKIKFNRDWSRRSWQDSIRPVFIDLNENELIWIKSGLGQKSGEGIRVSKQEFIDKYKG